MQKIFLFNFPFDEAQPELNLSLFPSDLLEIFPPAANGAILQAHCSELMGNVTVRLLVALDEQMRYCQSSNDAVVASPSTLTSFLKVSPIKANREPKAGDPHDGGGGGSATKNKPVSLQRAVSHLLFSEGKHADEDPSRRSAPVGAGVSPGSPPRQRPHEDPAMEALLLYHIEGSVSGAGAAVGGAASPSRVRGQTRQVRHGRVRKWMGDLCLQVGTVLRFISLCRR